jgi:flavin-binding protein dodecin
MTSFAQFEANRRNALRSTGPKTEEGKRRSRFNAVRHGLTAETVVGSLEDAEDYKAFEASIISDYCAETAVARELVLRLASLLWRLRRATAIETDLFEIEAEVLRERCVNVSSSQRQGRHGAVFRAFLGDAHTDALKHSGNGSWSDCGERTAEEHQADGLDRTPDDPVGPRQLTYCFLRLANLDSGVFERLNRYEAALWRQTVQTLFALQPGQTAIPTPSVNLLCSRAASVPDDARSPRSRPKRTQSDRLRLVADAWVARPNADSMIERPDRRTHTVRREDVMAKRQAQSVYRIVDVVGESSTSWEDAGKRAVEIAAASIRDLRVAEVVKMDMKVEGGKVTAFRTRVALSFKYEA